MKCNLLKKVTRVMLNYNILALDLLQLTEPIESIRCQFHACPDLGLTDNNIHEFRVRCPAIFKII
jgi:hypothetical protein